MAARYRRVPVSEEASIDEEKGRSNRIENITEKVSRTLISPPVYEPWTNVATFGRFMLEFGSVYLQSFYIIRI